MSERILESYFDVLFSLIYINVLYINIKNSKTDVRDEY